MLLTNICNKSVETPNCVCNPPAESDRQEFPFNLSAIDSLSSNSLYYEEEQFDSEINEPPTKCTQNVQKSSVNPTVEICYEQTTSVDLPPISWHGYNCLPKFLSVCNTGRSMLINGQWSSGKPYIEGGPLNGSYMFSQIHFHCPSEHQIDGKKFPLEMHVVHYKTSYLTQERAMEEKDGTVVLVYLFQVNDSCDTILSCFTKYRSQNKAFNCQSEISGIALSHIVQPFYSHYYIYWGSISKKGNSYLLQWIINCSNLYATTQEIHDLFSLLESGDSYDERVTHLMQPLNNTIYYAGECNLALSNLEETAVQCSDCYSNQGFLSACCQTSCNIEEEKKDAEVQVSSEEDLPAENNGFLNDSDPTPSCTQNASTESKNIYYDAGRKLKKCLEISWSTLGFLASRKNKTSCTSEPTICVDTSSENECSVKRRPIIMFKDFRAEKSCSKTFKKMKKCNTKNSTAACESKQKQKQAKCKEKPKPEKKEKCKKKEPAECESSRKSKSSKSKSKCKVKTSECNDKGKKKRQTSPSSDCTVNFLLTPNNIQSIPSLSLKTSESEEIKKSDITDAKAQDLKVPENTFSVSTYQSSKQKLKEPLTEFFLQTEHLFHTQKKKDFSMCTTQDFNVYILHKENVLQEFKGSFSPNKLEIGNCEKLNLTPKYAKPDKVMVQLEYCIVKMETLSKMCIRSKFLLKPDLNIAQGVQNDTSETSGRKPQNLSNPESEMKFGEIQENYENNIKTCDQSMSLTKIKKEKTSKNVKIISENVFTDNIINKLVSENRESEKQDYEIELLKGPPDEVETSKSTIFDSTDQPCEIKLEEKEKEVEETEKEVEETEKEIEEIEKEIEVKEKEAEEKEKEVEENEKEAEEIEKEVEENEKEAEEKEKEKEDEGEKKSQKSWSQKSDKSLKSLFHNRKKTLFFTYEKVEKDESSGKKVFVGKFRSKNEIKAFPKGKKLIQKNESYSKDEKERETKEEDICSLPNKELVVEDPINCESLMEEQELKNESFSKAEESYKVDDEKNVFILHHFNPKHSESEISDSESKLFAFPDEEFTITPDSNFSQKNKLLKQSNAGSVKIQIKKSTTLLDSGGPQIIIPVDLDSRKFKQTEIEIQVSQDSQSSGDENTKKKNKNPNSLIPISGKRRQHK